MHDRAGQRTFQAGCLLKGIVTRDAPISPEQPERLLKSEYSVVNCPPSRPQSPDPLSPTQPGGWEDTGAAMGFNTGG